MQRLTGREVVVLVIVAVLMTAWVGYVTGRQAESLMAYESGWNNAMESEWREQAEAEAYLQGLADGYERFGERNE